MTPLALLRLFIENDAAFVLIGGLAAVLQGVPVTTNDIDLCYDLSPDNRKKIATVLAPLRPALRVAGLSPTEARALPFVWDARTLRNSPNVTLSTDAGDIDLLAYVPGIGSYSEVIMASHTIVVDDLRIPILDLPGLIAAKRAAGRPKDLMALPHIEATLLRREEQPSE